MKKFIQTRDFCAESVAMTAKDVFLTQLNYIYYSIERNGMITKYDIENELELNKKNEKQSLFGKMINKEKPKHNSNLQLIFSLLKNLELEYIDCAIMKNIITNSSRIYNLYYRAEYENIQRDIFLQGHLRYVEDYEI